MSNPTPDHNVTRDNQQPVSPGATPRTDREQYQVIPGADHKEDAVVSVDFARELERENNALRARVAELSSIAENRSLRITTLSTEAQSATERAEKAEKDAMRAENLRDEEVAHYTKLLNEAGERADALRRECERLSTCCKEQELTASQLVKENQILRHKNAAYEERHQ